MIFWIERRFILWTYGVAQQKPNLFGFLYLFLVGFVALGLLASMVHYLEWYGYPMERYIRGYGESGMIFVNFYVSVFLFQRFYVEKYLGVS